jgi:uncharacterized protein (TIGR03118 family)
MSRRLFLEPLEDRCVLSPVVLDTDLAVRTVVSGLTQPTSLVFLGTNDFFVTEKTTGKVDHVINGVNIPTQFDLGKGLVPNLPVNFNSERGLLGITLSPDFAHDHFVYLYWTENNSGPAPDGNVADVPVLGNRVDRFSWDSGNSTLTLDRNIIRLHAFQNDGNGGNPAQMQGNHNGGVIKFGPDRRLYIVIGDNGRRGWLQNLIDGPNGPGQTDENNGPVRGGPAPDDAHLTGVVLRLNYDGSTPDDNPFADIGHVLQAPLLTGANERPNPTTSNGKGSFTAFLDQAMQKLTVIVSFQGLSSPTLAGGAHIHFGSPDKAGPIILPLTDFPGGLSSGQFTTTLTAANFRPDPADGINTFQDAVGAILSGQTYFNIHTTRFPAGELRGQIGLISTPMGSESDITANLHKIFAYGVRNTFGFDFDPTTGRMWLEEDGDQSFDKISIVAAGANNGWIQSSGPLFNNDGTLDAVARAEFKSIEVRVRGLQQSRWPATNIADTPEQALNRLVMLPGAFYNNPVFSVRGEIPPAGLGFLASPVLGPQYENLLFEGEARDNFPGSPFRDRREQFDGALFAFRPNRDRTGLDFGGDPNVRTTDNVFTNDTPFDLKGDRSFLFGTNFGLVTDIVTGPDGNLYAVSLSGGDAKIGGAVFEVFRKDFIPSFQQTNLVSDVDLPANFPGGKQKIIDSNLRNPWGVSFGPTSPFWISDQRAGVTTLYSSNADGSTVAKVPLTVTIPPAPGRAQGTPTGQVFNGTTDFMVNGAPARFLFANLDGTIAAWNGIPVLTKAVTVATTPGAVYTGLTIDSTGSGNFLYAANVGQGRIDVFDTNFQRTTLAGDFTDPFLSVNVNPLDRFVPFNIQNIGGLLFVAYQRDVFNPDGSLRDREHDGIVDVFDPNGNFIKRLVTGGLNAPWGLARAPDDFGPFSGALLVGNFGQGDGKINAFDLQNGQFLGYVSDANGNPLAIERLWALTLGNGVTGGNDVLFFAAGINNEADGLFGSIRDLEPSMAPVGPDFAATAGATGSMSASSLPPRDLIADPGAMDAAMAALAGPSSSPLFLTATASSPPTLPASEPRLPDAASVDRLFASHADSSATSLAGASSPAPTDDPFGGLFQQSDSLF